jgi:hypothetical protein
MPAAETIFEANTGFLQKVNLADYQQCRFLVNKGIVAGNPGSVLVLRYATAFSINASSYATISTAEASVGVAVQNQYLDTGWLTLVEGAKDDVFLAVIGIGGNGTLDPVFGSLVAEFRQTP